ncbi:hypothetical protein VCHENC03_2419 [Vibrio sp. HENC-03]|nr:hypothetical protein VCHENC03_2419 [Vibrio sp. HENC-03]
MQEVPLFVVILATIPLYKTQIVRALKEKHPQVQWVFTYKKQNGYEVE